MSRFRFLHAADIHLDSPLRGLEGYDGGIAERIRTAPRAALENLIERAIAEPVDFLIIAGDLYDGPWRDYRTGLFFAEQMGRLNDAGVPVFLLYGNHDAESQITKRLSLPENVRTFASRKAQSFSVEELGVVLHGQSFREKAVTANLVPDYPSPVPDMFNIGVLHTGLGGRTGAVGIREHDNYAPCTVAELTAKGYDYWALGHIHHRQVLREHPWVVFPGNLQGRHMRETGPKGAFLVSVDDGEISKVEPVDFDVVRWADLSVSAKGAETPEDAVAALEEALETAAAEAEGRLLVCRVRLTGRTRTHSRLIADHEHLLAEARSRSVAMPGEGAWVAELRLETRSMEVSSPGVREDALGDLVRMIEAAGEDEEVLETLRNDLSALVQRLRPEVREGVADPVLRAALGDDPDYPRAIREAAPYLLARLTAEDA